MAKIYKIESLECNDIYFGCTTKKYLSERMTYYRHEYKKYIQTKQDNDLYNKYINMEKEYGHDSLLKLFELFDKYNINTFKINLVSVIDSRNKELIKSQLFDFIKNNNLNK